MFLFHRCAQCTFLIVDYLGIRSIDRSRRGERAKRGGNGQGLSGDISAPPPSPPPHCVTENTQALGMSQTRGACFLFGRIYPGFLYSTFPAIFFPFFHNEARRFQTWSRHPRDFLKGTVSQDFLLPVFFTNQFPPSPRV